MKKSLLLISIINCIIIFGCNYSDSYKEFSYKDLVDSEVIYNATDTTLGLSMLNDFKVYKDSLAIFTDLFTNYMYKYDFSMKNIRKIGNIGKGPGEYLRPFKMFIKNNIIYYSDLGTMGIRSFDFNAKNFQSYNNKNINNYIRMFLIDDQDNIYNINDPSRTGYFVFSSNGNKYVPALKIFKENNLRGFPISGAFINKSKLYFTFLIDSKIYSIDLLNNKEEYFKIDIKGFCNWDAKKDEKMEKETIKDIHERYLSISNFLGFEYNNKTFFYLYIHDPKNDKNDKEIICDNKGKILFVVKDINPFYIQTISNDKSYAYTMDNKEFLIKQIKWNKKFRDLLDNSK